MNEAAVHLLWALLRTSVVLTVSALMLSAFLRVFRVSSPTVRRTAYFAILLQGCLFVKWPVEVPLPRLVTAFVDRATRNAPGKLFQDSRLQNRFFQNSLDENGGSAATPTALRGRASDAKRIRTPTQSRGRGTHQARADEPQLAASLVVNDLSLVAAVPDGVPADAAKTFDGADASLTVPATNQSTRPTPFPWAIGLVALWAAGIVVLTGRSAWNYVRFLRHLPPLQKEEPEWADEWNALQRDAGLRRLVPLAVAEQAGPMLCRLPRGYRLIVPALAWRALEPSQRLLVLRHELAHLQRRDVWKSLGLRVLALPHWFNPLVWQIVGQFDECAEWACDEAARRAAPDHAPDYARALLQLVHRAQPVFFATRAARERGLSHRIRRLLTPATEKGAKMKKAMLAMLVLGITLVSVTRLRLRGNENPPPPLPVTVTRTLLRESPASAVDRDVAVAAQTPQTHRRAITVMVPHTTIEKVPRTTIEMVPRARIEMVPVTKTEMVPESRIADVVEPAAPATRQDPIFDSVGVVNPATISTRASGPTAPPADAAPAAVPSAAIASGLESHPVADASAAPRLAKIDLQSVVRRMQEYQRESARISTELENLKKARQAARAKMLTSAQARMKLEQDPVMREVIDKGMIEKLKEMMQEENVDVGSRSSALTQRMLHKIVNEVAVYAKEHHILVVRRERFVPSPSPGRAGLSYSTVYAPGAIGLSPAKEWGPPASGRPEQLWNNDVIYSSDQGSPKEIDISDEILERLNKADDASNRAQKGPDFSFYVGVTR